MNIGQCVGFHGDIRVNKMMNQVTEACKIDSRFHTPLNMLRLFNRNMYELTIGILTTVCKMYYIVYTN